MKIILLFLVSFIGNYAFTQSDSKSVLDKVAKVHNAYNTIQSEFKFSTTAPDGEKSKEETGKIFLKGDRYHLIVTSMDVIFDGKSIYTYLPESKEINITKPEPSKVEKGDFFFSNPRDVFKGYNKNFKSTFSKENNKDNGYYDIDLFPINLKTKYNRIHMRVNRQTYHIKDIQVVLKDGTKYNLEFVNFLPNTDVPDKEFVFNAKKFPGAEVNDMRF